MHCLGLYSSLFSFRSVLSREGFPVSPSKSTYRLSWGLGVWGLRLLWPPSDSAAILHLQRGQPGLCILNHGILPEADLVAHSFLVLLVGCFQGGSGGANIDL